MKISTNGNPFYSPNGFLPYIKDDNEKIAGYDEIISYLQSKVSHLIRIGLQFDLNPTATAHTVSLTLLIVDLFIITGSR